MKNIGISSLLVVFIILALLTFASLSLSTAKSDYNLSQKAADHKTEYYAACNKAETMLNEIESGARKPDGSSWLIEMNDNQALEVEVRLSPNQNGGYDYEIKKWTVISTAHRDYNQKLNLLQQ